MKAVRSVNYPESPVAGGQLIENLRYRGRLHSETTPTDVGEDASISGSSTAFRKDTQKRALITSTRVVSLYVDRFYEMNGFVNNDVFMITATSYFKYLVMSLYVNRI